MASQQQTARSAVLAEVAAGRIDEARTRLNKEETSAWRELKDELLNGIVLLSAEAEQVKKQLADDNIRTLRMIVFIAVAAILAMIILSWMIGLSLLRQLGGEPAAAVTLAQRIASGDLTQTITVATGDDHSLMAAFAQMGNPPVFKGHQK